MNLRRSEWTKEKEACANAARLKAVKTKPKRMKRAKSQTEGYLGVAEMARKEFRDAIPKRLVKGVHWHNWTFVTERGRYMSSFSAKPPTWLIAHYRNLFHARLVRVKLVEVK